MLKPRHTNDSTLEVGIDEAGRGCLWGPLVAGAVIWPAEATWTEKTRALATQVRDSKKLSAKRRAVLEEGIKEVAVAWALGRVEAQEIDTLGMTRANRLAFQRALEGVTAVATAAPGRVLIDGVLGLTPDVLAGREQIVEARGDGTYLAIAAASILAKEGRDRIVGELCAADASLDTRYGLMSSKGYGTLRHREGVKKHGMDAGHRRLFLRKLLGLEHTISGDGTAAAAAAAYDFLED